MYARKKLINYYEGKIEPFKIVDGLYFVGSYKESSHLVDTGDGLLLIDVGNIQNVYLIIDSIRKLGFKPEDVKYILLTHRHSDHIGGVKELAGYTGAKTYISEKSENYLRENNIFKPDVLLKDGDRLKFGKTEIECLLTPGHTEDTMSFFFNVKDGDKIYRAGTFGGAGPATLVKSEDSDYYEGCREDYLNSVDRLLKEKADIFIGNHCWNNDTENKGKAIKNGENPFIDGGAEWRKFLNFCKKRALEIIRTNKLEIEYKN